MAELCGWLFDLYADPQDGLVLWLLEEGEHTTPRRLTQSFPVTFYTAGETGCLRQAWRYLRSQSIPLKLSRTERRDLFQAEPVTAREGGPRTVRGLPDRWSVSAYGRNLEDERRPLSAQTPVIGAGTPVVPGNVIGRPLTERTAR